MDALMKPLRGFASKAKMRRIAPFRIESRFQFWTTNMCMRTEKKEMLKYSHIQGTHSHALLKRKSITKWRMRS